jgi:hypothetical protein
MDLWQDVLKTLGSVAIVMAVLGWLARSLVTHLLSRDVEQYKNRLHADATRALENFRAELQLANKEHEIRFGRLHDKRMEVLADLYGQLWQLFRLMQQLAAMDRAEEAAIWSKAQETIAILDEVFLLFKRHRLYVGRDIALNVDLVLVNVHTALLEFRPQYSGERVAGHELVSRSWRLTDMAQPGTLSQALFRIEEAFRQLLGGELEAQSYVGPPRPDAKTSRDST